MSSKVTFIDYRKHPSSKVAKFLLLKGFDLGTDCGYCPESNDLLNKKTESIGIMSKNLKQPPQKCLFGLITQKPRRVFLGTIWFNNHARNASEQNWVFEVYGREYAELTMQLAEEMASSFNVNIVLCLEQDQVRTESDPSDSGL